MFKGYFIKYKFQKCSRDTLLNKKTMLRETLLNKIPKMFKGYFIKYQFQNNVQGILYWIPIPKECSIDTLLNTNSKKCSRDILLNTSKKMFNGYFIKYK